MQTMPTRPLIINLATRAALTVAAWLALALAAGYVLGRLLGLAI